MPIIIPESRPDPALYDRLAAAHIPLIDEIQAQSEDIRPARIGIMNLMPAAAMQATETQWLKWIGGQALLQIEPVLIKFDNDRREQDGASRQDILRRYTPFSEVSSQGLDGLIITGDNLEIQQHVGFASRDPLPFEDIRYYKQLCEVIDWAGDNVSSTIFSCLASHFALNYKYGLKREITNAKTFGVYEHTVISPESPLMRGMNDTIKAPHSRWGNTPIASVEAEPGLNILAASDQVGWLAIEQPNASGHTDLLLQGHPEYEKYGLDGEYQRDAAIDRNLPANYYQGDEPDTSNVRLSWSTDARVLHENWIGQIFNAFAQPDMTRRSAEKRSQTCL